MNKKILAAALAGLCLVSVAQAEVKISGIVQKSIDYGNVKGADNQFSMQDIGTRIYFSGTDKLDSGANLKWMIQSWLNKGFGSREAWIGYESADLGLLKFGRAKMVFGELIDDYDLFESNTTLGNTFTDGLYDKNGTRPGSVIYYKSPTFAGFQAKATYSIGTGNRDDAYSYNGVLNYTNSFVAVNAGALKVENVARDAATLPGESGVKVQKGASLTSYQLGARVFPVDGLQVGALYQTSKQTLTTGGDYDRDSVLLMAQYEIGKWVPRLGYVHQFEGEVTGHRNLNSADHYQAGFDYNITKQSIWYVEGAYIDNNGDNAFATSISAGKDSAAVVSTGLVLLF